MYYHLLKRIVLLLIVSFLLLPHVVQAEARVDPKEEEQGGIELDSQRFPYNHYEPITDTSGDWNPFTLESVDKGLNAIASMLFSITKLLANLIDVSLANLYSVNIIDNLANTIDNVSSSLWDNLRDNFGTVLLVIAAIQIFAYYVGQRNSSKAGGATLKLIFVIVLGFVWFSNSSFFLNTLNNISNEVQGIVMSSGTFLADEEIEEGNELEGSQALMRNRVFELLVYKPYLEMNYGSTNEESILANDEDGAHRINDLLSLQENEEGLEERETIAKNEVEDLQNMNMSSSNIPSKVGIAMVSIVLAIMMGLPLVIIAMVNILLQVLALIIAVVLPISFIVSFLPSFSNSGTYTLGKLVGVFLMKVFAGLLLLFTFLLMEITETIISTNNVGLYILNVLVTSVLLILMLVKRDKIVEFITAGRVTAVSEGINNASNKASNKLKEMRMRKEIRKSSIMNGNTAQKSAAMYNSGEMTESKRLAGNSKQKINNRKALRHNQKFRDDQNQKGNVVDLNEFKNQKGEDGKAVSPTNYQGESLNRENIARTKQDYSNAEHHSEQSNQNPGVGKQPNQQKQPKNVRVNNTNDQTIERKNRNSQTTLPQIREQEASNKSNRNEKKHHEQLRQNANKKDLNEQRRQARTSQQHKSNVEHKNPNNTPITQWEAQKEIRKQRELNATKNKNNKIKRQPRAINRDRTKNEKRIKNNRKRRNRSN